MWYQKQYIISESQRGLLFKNQQLVAVLTPGVHKFWDWSNRYQLQSYVINNTLQEGVKPDVIMLADLHPELFAEQLQFWETGEHQVGLVYQQGVLREIKAPGQRGAWWKTQQPITLETLDISETFSVSEPLLRVLSGAREPLLSRSASAALAVASVAEGHMGFLEVDGNTQATLKPGLHLWWKFNRIINVQQFDLRLQNMEVNGQEILTSDRVSLRINLSTMWQITDAAKVKRELADAKDYLYRELQLALRTVVSTQTLDELLADKNLLNEQVQSLVVEKAAGYGISLKSVGARQEETHSTRSMHNTAKVMEGNPVLLRLKELEVLEKIAARISNLNVYGGLDGVMNDLVKLTSDKARV